MTTTSTTENEIGMIKSRYKMPNSSVSILKRQVISNVMNKPSENFTLATAIAGFGFQLRGENSYGSIPSNDLITMVKSTLRNDKEGRRSELIQLIKKAELLQEQEKLSISGE